MDQLDRMARTINEYRLSPLAFIKDMWGLTPQPLKLLLRSDLPAEDYNPDMFEDFIKGKHVTWQQWLILRAVENAMQGGIRWITVSAGHGIGKSTTEAWLVLWFLFVWKNSKIGCTAPSGDQLFDVLWSEISLWLREMPEPVQKLYNWQSDYLRIVENEPAWYARARTSRKDKPEALAGLHADNLGLFVDEASGVDEVIYKTAHGSLTNKNTLVLLISNPTRNLGYFYDSHNNKAEKDRWQRLQFSSLESPIVDSSYIDLIRTKYGEGSTEWRIRVVGRFPLEDGIDEKGYVQLIPSYTVISEADYIGRKKLGVDPSGMGNNKTVFVMRDKFKAEVYASYKKSTPMQIAEQVATILLKEGIEDEDCTIDIFGVGAETYQILATMGHDVMGVNVDMDADDKDIFMNKRAEAAWRVKEWLHKGADLVDNEGWEDIKTPRYKRNVRGKIQLMPKVEMAKEGLKSPDHFDALMLTFVDEDIDARDNEEEYDGTDLSAGALG